MTVDTGSGGSIANDDDALRLFQQARFTVAAHQLAQLPPDRGAEIAFAGRSNVGKSSLVNALCQRRALARTSRTPGRTQQLVVFELDAGRRFVDLPGFGYARVARTQREHWAAIIPQYLERRASLAGTVLIADARHPLRPAELELLAWCARAALPAMLLLNKSDKLGRAQAGLALRRAQAAVASVDSGIECRLVSAETGAGVPALRARIAAWLAPDRERA